MSATVLGRTWAFCCPMLPTKECSSGTRVQDGADCTQTAMSAPSNPEHGQKTGTEDKCSHPPLTSASGISSDTFCLIALDIFFFCCRIIFYLMTGELGAVPIKHGEGQCPVRGRTGELEWLQIGSLERSGLLATICRKSSHPPTALNSKLVRSQTKLMLYRSNKLRET